MATTCTRRGCGKTFDPSQNTLAACTFHPGQPVFHEGLKSWSCCKEKNKPVMEFEAFMKIEGCASGVHSEEKPPKIVQANNGDCQKMMDICEDAKTSAPLKLSHHTTTDVFKPIQPDKDKDLRTPPAQPRVEPQDDPESIIPDGAKCRRTACGITWNGLGNIKRGPLDKEECTYHPGTPIFHEGSKGYSCCKRRVLDFDDFLKLRGCTKGSHLFTTTRSACEDKMRGSEEIESVQCRFDFYQTPTTVIVSIFAKNVVRDQSLVTFDPLGMDIVLELPGKKRFQKRFELFGSIDPHQSSYKLLSTKCEIVLVKSDGRSWSNLEKGDAFAGAVTFGVGGRTGTVGAKQIVTS